MLSGINKRKLEGTDAPKKMKAQKRSSTPEPLIAPEPDSDSPFEAEAEPQVQADEVLTKSFQDLVRNILWHINQI
jgi:hypothetical protein